MKSLIKTAATVVALFVASTGTALANLDLPEPSSMGLVGVGVAAAVYFLRKKGK